LQSPQPRSLKTT